MNRKFRFHFLGLVHLPCSMKYSGCAFTTKNHKLIRMLLSLEHEVFYYGAEGSDVPCTEFIQTHTLKELQDTWGDKPPDPNFTIGYDWQRNEFRHDFNSPRTEVTRKYYANCIQEINKRKRDDDFLLLTQGQYHRPIDEGVKLFLTVEPGVGYRGSYCRFKAFESSYVQNFTYGSFHPFQSISGSYYDRVIPNFFDPVEFTFNAIPQDYYLFIGRIIKRKGIITAYEVCKALNKHLIIVGQDGVVLPDGRLTAKHNPDFSIPEGDWEYYGYAGPQDRNRLMGNAIATFTPTEYLEPFGGTHIESMLTGTPPITTDFGVFPETIPNLVDGVVGFRCNTLQDFVNAAKAANGFSDEDRRGVREHGERFLMDNVRWRFEKWFQDLYHLYLSAVDPNQKGWHYLEKPEEDGDILEIDTL